MVCETQTRLPERAARQAPVVVEPQTEAEVEVAEGHLVLCEYRGLVDRPTAAEVQKTAAPRKVEGQQTGLTPVEVMANRVFSERPVWLYCMPILMAWRFFAIARSVLNPVLLNLRVCAMVPGVSESGSALG